MHVIGVLNPKGGAGKSTLATNLASALQRGGAAVLLVDSDAQGTARDWFASREEAAAGPDVAGLSPLEIERTLKRIGGGYDHVVIDGAAKIEAHDSVRVVKACDLVLIPVQPTPADVWGASDLVEIVEARRAVTGGHPIAALVVSRQIASTRLAASVEDVLASFDLPVFQARTTQRVAYAEAMLSGGSVYDTEDAKAVAEVEAIKDELLALLGGVKHG